jgi:hypothetical protein
MNVLHFPALLVFQTAQVVGAMRLPKRKINFLRAEFARMVGFRVEQLLGQGTQSTTEARESLHDAIPIFTWTESVVLHGECREIPLLGAAY